MKGRHQTAPDSSTSRDIALQITSAWRLLAHKRTTGRAAILAAYVGWLDHGMAQHALREGARPSRCRLPGTWWQSVGLDLHCTSGFTPSSAQLFWEQRRCIRRKPAFNHRRPSGTPAHEGRRPTVYRSHLRSQPVAGQYGAEHIFWGSPPSAGRDEDKSVRERMPPSPTGRQHSKRWGR